MSLTPNLVLIPAPQKLDIFIETRVGKKGRTSPSHHYSFLPVHRRYLLPSRQQVVCLKNKHVSSALTRELVSHSGSLLSDWGYRLKHRGSKSSNLQKRGKFCTSSFISFASVECFPSRGWQGKARRLARRLNCEETSNKSMPEICRDWGKSTNGGPYILWLNI